MAKNRIISDHPNIKSIRANKAITIFKDQMEV